MQTRPDQPAIRAETTTSFLLPATSVALMLAFRGLSSFGYGILMGSLWAIITDPVETQVRDFYYRRTVKSQKESLEGRPRSVEDEVELVRKKLAENDNSLNSLSDDERDTSWPVCSSSWPAKSSRCSRSKMATRRSYWTSRLTRPPTHRRR